VRRRRLTDNTKNFVFLGIVTMQLLVAIIVIALILTVLLISVSSRSTPPGPAPRPRGEAIVAAALFVLVGILVSEWIVWTAIIGVLLLPQ
jgi:hypothetical protein